MPPQTVRKRTAALLLALSLAAFAALCVLQHAPMADLLVYRAEGAAVAHGTDLYGFTVTRWRLPATYPPFAAILFVPAAWLPLPALKAAFLAGNALLLAALIALSARLAGRTVSRPLLGTATALFLRLVPHEGARDLRLPWWQQPLASPYPLLGPALVAAAALRAAQPVLSSARISSASTIR